MGRIRSAIGSHLIAILFWGLILYASGALAGNIKQPPVLTDLSVPLQLYLQEIANNFNVLQEVSTSPNGTVSGRKNEVVIYNNSGTRQIFVNTDGATVWQQL